MSSQGYLKSGERQAATIDSVLELAGESNPSDITTSQIAEKMGVTQGAIFRHFPTKSAIWSAVMDSVSRRLLGRVEEAAAEHADPIEALRAMFTAHVQFVAAHPGVPRIVFGELQRRGDTVAKTAVRKLLSRYAVVIEMQVKRGQAMGLIRRDLDPPALASLYIGTVQGLVIRAMLDGEAIDLTTLAPSLFDLIEHAIRSES